MISNKFFEVTCIKHGQIQAASARCPRCVDVQLDELRAEVARLKAVNAAAREIIYDHALECPEYYKAWKALDEAGNVECDRCKQIQQRCEDLETIIEKESRQ